MPKKLAAVIFSVLLIITNFSIGVAAVNAPLISAQSAILITADTKTVIFSKNEREKRGMASTTKIMTAVLALEKAMPQRYVTVKAEDVAVEGTSVGLKGGDKITLWGLVAAMLLESGNDAANATATAVSGDREAFLKLMNEKAASLGMVDTHFENPSGLPSEKHYSTAYDMALLASYAVSIPEFTEICSEKKLSVSFGAPEREHIFTNHNKLLSLYEGAFGIKTGFTKSSGRCLVSAVKKDGVTLIAVTLNAPDDWNDHIKLYEYGFSCIEKILPLNYGDVSVAVAGSDVKSVKVHANPEYFTIPKGLEYSVEIFKEQFALAPVKKGDILGKLVLKDKAGRVLGAASLVCGEDAAVRPQTDKKNEKQSLFKRIINFIKDLFS